MYVGGLPLPDHFSSTARQPVFSISPLLMLYWFSPRPAPPPKEHVAPGERETYPSPHAASTFYQDFIPRSRKNSTISKLKLVYMSTIIAFTLLVQRTDCQKGWKRYRSAIQIQYTMFAYFRFIPTKKCRCASFFQRSGGVRIAIKW